MGWIKIVLGLLGKLLPLLMAWKAGKDDERADNAEKTVETVDRVAAPIADDERERLWAQNVAKFGGGVRDDPGT